MCRFKGVASPNMADAVISFNTSYVSVQAIQQIVELFIDKKFQYIICVGSRHKKEIIRVQLRFGFNTSYVSVQGLIMLYLS